MKLLIFLLFPALFVCAATSHGEQRPYIVSGERRVPTSEAVAELERAFVSDPSMPTLDPLILLAKHTDDPDSKGAEAVIVRQSDLIVGKYELASRLSSGSSFRPLRPRGISDVVFAHYQFVRREMTEPERRFILKAAIQLMGATHRDEFFDEAAADADKVPDFDPDRLEGWIKLVDCDRGLQGGYFVALLDLGTKEQIERLWWHVKKKTVMAQRNLAWAFGLAHSVRASSLIRSLHASTTDEVIRKELEKAASRAVVELCEQNGELDAETALKLAAEVLEVIPDGEMKRELGKRIESRNREQRKVSP